MPQRLVVLSLPQLRRRDVTPGAIASLESLSRLGSLVDLIPAFPGLAASSFATLMTGTGPDEHGIVGDTYYDRAEGRIAGRPLPDSAVLAPKLWEWLKRERPEAKVMLWFAPSTHGAEVDLAAWADAGATLSTRPEGLAAELVARFGPLPASASPTDEPPRLEAMAWLLATAASVIVAEAPDLAVVRVPYLGQVARRYGPDGREAGRSVRTFEAGLREFLALLPRDTAVVVATESVSTPVFEPTFPNRILRGLGLLSLKSGPSGGLDIDLNSSAAFALADHQICHLYLNDPRQIGPVAAAFAGPHGSGVAQVASMGQRAALGMDHPRAGDVILVAEPDRWFAPDWWSSRAEAPGHPPVSASGMALATAGGLLLNPEHVQGSLGAPPPGADYLGVLVSSVTLPPAAISGPIRASEVFSVCQRLLA